jgi:hypothetical protein
MVKHDRKPVELLDASHSSDWMMQLYCNICVALKKLDR